MGVKNLLKELQPITSTVHLSQFRFAMSLFIYHCSHSLSSYIITITLYSGQTAGIDASCWLHRAAHSCCLDLVLGRPNNKYLQFTCKCLNVLLGYNITPIVIFDGGLLPMKANEENKRNKIRSDKREEVLKLHSTGNKEAAWKAAAAAVRVNQERFVPVLLFYLAVSI